jgi:hypothetical protein
MAESGMKEAVTTAMERDEKAQQRAYIMTIFDKNDERQTSAEQAAINAGLAAVRALFLLNGGACIALLGFLSSTYAGAKRTPGEVLAAKAGALFGTVTSIDAETALIAQITGSLTMFAWGAGFAVLTSGLAYFVNYTTAISFGAMERNWKHPFVHNTARSLKLDKIAGVLTLFSFLSGAVSFAFFILGVLKVQNIY